MAVLLRLLGIALAAVLAFLGWMAYFATRPVALQASPADFTIDRKSVV